MRVRNNIRTVSNIKLTKRLIDSVSPTDTDQLMFDSEITGFALKVAPSGRKTFILKYRTASGRQRKPTIGRYGDITLEQARKIARDWKAKIIQGGDPSGEKRGKTGGDTLNNFAKRYFQTADKKKSTLKVEQTNFRLYVEPTLGKLIIAQIKRADVQAWLNGLGEIPSAANRTVSLLSAMFTEAERQQLREEGSNPCRLVRRYSSKPRDRYLSLTELGRFMRALDTAETKELFHPSVVPALRLLLLTGARKTEVLSLKWEWVDFDRRLITLPDSKTGPRKVYLPESAIQVLNGINKLKGNPHVFWGANVGDFYKDLKKPFRRILELAEISDFRIHDLRHTHAAHAVMAGVPLNIIAKTLGHSQTRTTERYAHVDDDPALKAINKTVSSFRLLS